MVGIGVRKEKLREKELERRAKTKMMDRRYVW
jgi:hypothetical protein